jgi:hypothetical protein
MLSMVRRVLFAVVFAGCYAPRVPSGVSCSESGSCPRGQTCIAGVCDGADPNLDASGDSAMVDAPPDSLTDANPMIGWAVPAKITELSSPRDDFGPSLFANGLRIYIASDRTVLDTFKIWYAPRATTAQPFSPPAPAAELDLSGNEYDPEVSAGGLELHYGSSAAPVGVRTTSRPGTSDNWTVPPDLVGIGASREGPSLALGDTRMVVSVVRTGGIEEWERATTSSPWVLLRGHPSLATLAYPGISSDGLELYATHISDGQLFRATRATTSDVFGAPQRYLFGTSIDAQPIYDPELTPDGKTMYLSIDDGSSFDIYVTTRP